MLFNSFPFAVFFLLVLAAYVLSRRRLHIQNVVLLVASYTFYGWWDWRFLLLILASTLIDYVCGRLLDRCRGDTACLDATPDAPPPATSARTRRAILVASVCANLGILGFFKYYDFFAASCAEVLQAIGLPLQPRLLHVILPVGISFYTFQTLSYTIDIYRGHLRAHRNLIDFAVFVSFFPQLVAGPIVRARDFLPQIARPRVWHWERVYEGCYLILWGLFKKVVIADNVAVVADRLFSGDTPTNGAAVLVAAYAFAVQIYCDFSGYSDIARGTARILGFDIALNFDLPYFSASPSEFWRRWHISLSSWLRDYLYVPLGGNKRGPRRTLINLMLTMLLGGLWHGAAWTFVIWGLYQGLLLIAYRVLTPSWHRTTAALGAPSVHTLRAAGIVLFFHLVCFGWLIFRADSVSQFVAMIDGLVGPWHVRGTGVTTLVVCALPLLIMQLAQIGSGDLEVVLQLPAPVRGLTYTAMFLGLAACLGAQIERPFIYFQF